MVSYWSLWSTVSKNLSTTRWLSASAISEKPTNKAAQNRSTGENAQLAQPGSLSEHIVASESSETPSPRWLSLKKKQ